MIFRLHGFLLVVFLVFATQNLEAQERDRAEVVDGIAAVVNGDVITFTQVRELVGSREAALRATLSGSELSQKVAELRKSAVNDLIDRQLILQEFKKKQFSIPSYLIEDRIRSIIIQEFGGDRSAFVRTLQSQGYTVSRFKEIETDKAIVQAMRQANVKDDFVISPAVIQKYYDKNKYAYTTPGQVKLRMIVLREGASTSTSDVAANSQSSEDKQGMANEIRDKIAAGADFERMASMYSDDPSTRDTGGDWGWIEKNTLNPELSDVAFALKPGEVSQVIDLGDSYYILMIEAKRVARTKSVSEVREEIERSLMQEERMRAQQRWIESLRRKAYIKIFV